jgi:putative DNA primase/helicase
LILTQRPKPSEDDNHYVLIDTPRKNFTITGVYCKQVCTIDDKGKTELDEPNYFWKCSPLKAIAKVRDTTDAGYSILWEYISESGITKYWLIPRSLLVGRSAQQDLITPLLDGGLIIDPKSYGDVVDYMSQQSPDVWLTSTYSTGWHTRKDGTRVFVLPNKIMGQTDEDPEQIVFAPTLYGHDSTSDYTTNGTLEEWQIAVADLCVGNPLLLFALSVAFSGPILEPLAEESGVVHLQKKTSEGKTTVLATASSV